MNYITNFPTYAKTSLTEDDNIYISNTTPINEIERTICKILDKYSEMCKYYINITESAITVSFNVGLDQYEAMVGTMVEIKLYKTDDEKSIITISKEITQHSQWQELYQNLLSKLKK